MRINTLIKLLQDYQTLYGPDVQISVPDPKGVVRREIYIARDPVSTILTSRGEEVEW